MAQATKIEWTDQSWNFLRGCRRVSTGCGCDSGGGCYAERQAIRHSGPGGAYEGLVKMTPKGPRWTGKLSFHENILLAPLKRKTPTKYFVNSMSDLFYDDVTDEMLDKAFAVMALCPQHIFQILTKRPERMKSYLTNPRDTTIDHIFAFTRGQVPAADEASWRIIHADKHGLANVWLGVSVENQEYADKRIPLLLDTPAAVRWISAEPLLGPLNLTSIPIEYNVFLSALTGENYLGNGKLVVSGARPVLDNHLDWVVVGGESGPRSRPCDLQWIRSIVEQCTAADVPVFVKQLGAKPVFECDPRCSSADDAQLAEDYGILHDVTTCACVCHERLLDRKGGNPDEWPPDLRVREYPEVANV